jgi:hypothetical protein
MKAKYAFMLLLLCVPAFAQTTKPVKPFKTAEQIVNVIEPSDRPRNADAWTDATREFVRTELVEKALGREVQFAVYFNRFSSNANDEDKTETVECYAKPFHWGGADVTLQFHLSWSDQNKAREFRKLKNGDRLTMSGTLRGVTVDCYKTTEEYEKRNINGPPTKMQRVVAKVTIRFTVEPAATMKVGGR